MKHILFFLLIIVSTFSASAVNSRPQYQSQIPSDSIRVSLITCFPGEEVYALCGHEALRIRTAQSDSVWNYGIFDFDEPNFIYRFVKGETDYRLAGYPFEWFMPEYVHRGSKVVEQELNLSQDEAKRLRAMMQNEALPQNCKYRYNYIKDNCATRIVERLDSAAGTDIIYPRDATFPSWRETMRHYHANYPWYQFGIDLALGSGLDTDMGHRGDMFVPMIMMDKAAKAHFPDGRPLVRATRVLNEGTPDAVLPPTPWYLTPLFWSAILMALCIIVAIVCIRRKKIARPFYAAFFSLIGIVGCVSAFLVFISEHEATSPNLLVLWLNPLQLIIPICMWSEKTRFLAKAMACVDAIVLLALMLIWPLQNQSASFSVFPLMIATFVLALSYAIITFNPSYNNTHPAIQRPKAAKKSASRNNNRSKSNRNKNK